MQIPASNPQVPGGKSAPLAGSSPIPPANLPAPSAGITPNPTLGGNPIPVVTLEKITSDQFGTPAKPVSDVETLSNITLRKWVVGFLLGLFLITNLSVLGAIGSLAAVDYSITKAVIDHATTQPAAFDKLLTSPGIIASSRSVNSEVIMSLIGSTAVQVGAGVILITQYLFPKK